MDIEMKSQQRQHDTEDCLRTVQQHLGAATLKIAMRYPEMDLARSEEIAMHDVCSAILEQYAQNDPGLAFWAIGMLNGLSLTRLRSTRPQVTTIN